MRHLRILFIALTGWLSLAGTSSLAFTVTCSPTTVNGAAGSQADQYIGSDLNATISNPNCATTPRTTPGYAISVSTGPGISDEITRVSVIRQNALTAGPVSLSCVSTNPVSVVGVSVGVDTLEFPTPNASFLTGDCTASYVDGVGEGYDLTFSFVSARPVFIFGVPFGLFSTTIDAEMVVTPDIIPPTPTVTYSNYDRVDPFTATITFDEPVTGFTVNDIVATNAQLFGFTETTPGLVWTVTVQGAGSLPAPEISVPANVAQDGGGNDNVASAPVALPPPDGTAPVVAITGVPNGFTGPQTATITFDWGEDVVDFLDNDITVTGGTLGAISGGLQVWTAQLTVDGTQDVTIDVASAAALDGSGTPSAAASVTGTFASGVAAEELIQDFMIARGTALIAAQPELREMLGATGLSANAFVTRGMGTAQMHTGNQGPIWAALDAQWSDLAGLETTYTHLTFGAQHKLNDDAVLGLMLQLDHASSTEGAASIEGTGWLVGPYFMGRHEGLIVDARLLWGETDNSISPVGTYTDTFQTERVLGMVNLSGEMQAGAATFYPTLGWSYLEDQSNGYVDALSNPVAAQTVRLSEIEAAVDWSVPVSTDGTEFIGGVAGIFASEKGGNGLIEGGRGRVDLGVRRQGEGPVSFDVGVYADGLFQSDFERYGLDMSLGLEF